MCKVPSRYTETSLLRDHIVKTRIAIRSYSLHGKSKKQLSDGLKVSDCPCFLCVSRDMGD